MKYPQGFPHFRITNSGKPTVAILWQIIHLAGNIRDKIFFGIYPELTPGSIQQFHAGVIHLQWL